MLDLHETLPLLHIVSGIILTFSIERLLRIFFTEQLVNATTSLARRFATTPIAMKMIAVYKAVGVTLQPVKQSLIVVVGGIRDASSFLYNTTVLIINLTITTVQLASSQGASVSHAVASWGSKSPSITPYDIVRVLLPFLLLLLAYSLVYCIRVAMRHCTRQPLDGTRSPSR